MENKHLKLYRSIIILIICLLMGLTAIKQISKNNSSKDTSSDELNVARSSDLKNDSYEVFSDLSFMDEEIRILYNKYGSLYRDTVSSPMNLFYTGYINFRRDSNNTIVSHSTEKGMYYASDNSYEVFLDFLSNTMTENMINKLTDITFVEEDGYVWVLDFDGPILATVSDPYYLVFENSDSNLKFACILAEDVNTRPITCAGFLYEFVKTANGWRLDDISKEIYEYKLNEK